MHADDGNWGNPFQRSITEPMNRRKPSSPKSSDKKIKAHGAELWVPPGVAGCSAFDQPVPDCHRFPMAFPRLSTWIAARAVPGRELFGRLDRIISMNPLRLPSTNGFGPSALLIANLPDDHLEARLQRLAGIERRALTLLLAHLAEFDARRLYADRGHPSLFA